MVYIKKVETRGFKSLGSRPVHVNFDGKFIGITGPNGSGKSNIIDPILFALGQNSPKLMRVNRLRDLIFDGAGNNPSSDARVTLTLDNSDRTILPRYVDGAVNALRRFKTKFSQYYIY